MAGAEDSGAQGDAPAPDEGRLRRVRELLDELSPQERRAVLRGRGASTGSEEAGAAAQGGSKDSGKDRADGVGAEPEEQDESEAFYAGLEEDDDLIGSKLASRRAKRGKDGHRGPAGSTPRRRAPLSSAERIALVAAVILGIAAAIWYSDVGGLSSSPHGDAMAGAGARADATRPGTEQWAAEVSSIQAQIEADPSNLDLRVQLGRAYAGLGDYDRAIETLTGVTDEDPAKVEAWYYLGFSHMSTNPPDEAAAKAAWQRVIDLDPDSERAGKARSHMANLGSQGGSAGPQGTPADPIGSASATAEAVP